MSTEIEKLTQEDRDILLRAPAVVAILAAISDDGEVSKHEKAESIKLSHLRTYTSEELLHNFYKESEMVFESNFDDIMSKLPTEWEDKEEYLEAELTELNKVLPKLNEVYAKSLVNSLKSFARHVFKSNSHFLDYFVLPVFMNKVEKESFNPKIGE
ncbi:MAG: hypothetical protein CMP59_06180 [Flavobacteriales bacterium]|nr:hypothetical protein [Flavobacteriales bacterium]|tara:strand:+ start:317 stop:784 length:468 start_codon:yes stop_codon:yes gene_type:complete